MDEIEGETTVTETNTLLAKAGIVAYIVGVRDGVFIAKAAMQSGRRLHVEGADFLAISNKLLRAAREATS